MTGEASKAQDIFQDTLREAAFLAAKGEPPANRYWFFREARWRCLDVVAHGVQPEQGANESTEVSPQAPEQIEQLEPEQLAIWISAAPEPQRSAFAIYYLDEFNYREMMSVLGLKLNARSLPVVANFKPGSMQPCRRRLRNEAFVSRPAHAGKLCAYRKCEGARSPDAHSRVARETNRRFCGAAIV